MERGSNLLVNVYQSGSVFKIKQHAARLGISNATIKVHKSRVLEKMQAASLQQLALDIEQLGLR